MIEKFKDLLSQRYHKDLDSFLYRNSNNEILKYSLEQNLDKEIIEKILSSMKDPFLNFEYDEEKKGIYLKGIDKLYTVKVSENKTERYIDNTNVTSVNFKFFKEIHEIYIQMLVHDHKSANDFKTKDLYLEQLTSFLQNEKNLIILRDTFLFKLYGTYDSNEPEETLFDYLTKQSKEVKAVLTNAAKKLPNFYKSLPLEYKFSALPKDEISKDNDRFC